MGMSLYEALEDSALHKAALQRGSGHEIIIAVTDQAPHLPKQSHPDHFLIEWRDQDWTLIRTKTVDNRFGLWDWLSPAGPFDDWTPVSGGETKKRRKKEVMKIRLYAVLEDSPVRMAMLPYEIAGDTKKRWITVIGGMKPPAWNREVDPEAFRIEYSCEGEDQPFFIKRAPSFSELQKAISPYNALDEWKPVRSLEGKKEPNREEEWKQVFPQGSWGKDKSLYEALVASPIHAASFHYSSPELSTPRRYVVTDNAPDRERKLTIIYRYRVEWWDEGYEHYRSLIFVDNHSSLASTLPSASTIGGWQPVPMHDEEK